MRALVTFGPTYEPLDQVRRLTNFSTGKLGTELANYFVANGHAVTALQGFYSTYRKPCRAQSIVGFTTTDNLALRFQELAREPWDAIFHAAAVSDFAFGKVFRRGSGGELIPLDSGKFGTREGPLLAELVPTRKVIASLRGLFPDARIVGWKFEVDGSRERALELGRRQVRENRTNYCVVNGPAYGEGYGITGADSLLEDCATPEMLFERLEALVRPSSA
jgi:phosphopantothenate---cysteine ligase (CTP)